MARRRLKQHQWGEWMNMGRPISKERLLRTGKYIPAGEFRNVPLENR
jgi:hypothetical protein